MKLFFIWIFILMAILLKAQSYTSSIQGKVQDSESEEEIIGATVELYLEDNIIKTTVSDIHGEFLFEEVQIGSYQLKVAMLGFSTNVVDDINVQVAKTSLVTFKLAEQNIKLGSVDIEVNPKDKTNNTSISVSGRAFNLDEAKRYSGSRSDLARMASNYAGVQGNNDTRNDIIIRGNSPTGLLWRVEGIDIFNPNHFAVAGTNGGPVAMINHQVIAKSDFITGAFPAEYGNALSGVFDLNFRNGNNKKHDFNGQIGILGTELMAEGPLGKSRASYLVAYRYSTLGLFTVIGVSIGTQAIPQYQDLSFKLNFPLKKQARFSVFGMGGLSANNTIVSDYTEPVEDLFSWTDRDVYFNTGMGIVGSSYKKIFNKKLSLKSTAAFSIQDINANHDLVYRPNYIEGQTWSVDSIVSKLNYQFISDKVVSNTKLNYRLNTRNIFTLGYSAELLSYDFQDSLYNESTFIFDSRINVETKTYMFQPYAEWKYYFNEKLKFIGGLHYQYFALTQSKSIEPRLGLNYLLGEKSNIAIAYGRHSVVQPTYFYFQNFENSNGITSLHNRWMDFSKSDHYVLSYKGKLNKKSRLIAEVYYQRLFNIPVGADSSAYSLLNNGTQSIQVQAEDVVNEGTGTNMGIELTYERFFIKDIFILSTLSLFDSKYKDLNGIEYNTAFNGRYSYNLLGGKKFKIGVNKNFELGFKLTSSGGRYYTPIDLEESIKLNTEVLDNSRINEERSKDYFRLDIRLGYKVSLKKVSHEVLLDLVNVTNQKNQFREIFVNGDVPYTTFQNQLNFLPFLNYQIHF